MCKDKSQLHRHTNTQTKLPFIYRKERERPREIIVWLPTFSSHLIFTMPFLLRILLKKIGIKS